VSREEVDQASEYDWSGRAPMLDVALMIAECYQRDIWPIPRTPGYVEALHMAHAPRFAQDGEGE
jgi:hypothetical protein